MKLLTLGLEKYGQFDGAELRLAEADSHATPLTIVYGPNEAGKSTLLHAVRDLLFDWEPRTRAAFEHDVASLALTAKLALRDGTEVDVRRRRGRGDTLAGTVPSSGVAIDGAWLGARLGNPTRQLFESVFGFSLAKLAAGGEMLKSTEVKAALYSSGFGGAQPDAIRKELEEVAAGLYSDRGKNPALNVSARRLGELRKQLRDTTVKASEFEKTRNTASAKKSEADAAHAELLAARAALARLKALVAGMPLFRAHRAAREELASIVVPDTLAGSSATELQTLRAARDKRAIDLRKAEDDLARAQTEVASLVVDDALVKAGGRVEALYRRVEQHRKSVADLPKREAELRELRRMVTSRIVDLRPGWTLAMLRDAPLDAAARSEMEEAAAASEKARTQREQQAETLRDAEAALDRGALAAAPPDHAGDAEAARRALDGWSAFHAERERLAPAQKKLAAATRQTETLRRKLSPPLDGAADAEAIPVLRAEEIRAFVGRFEEAARVMGRAQDALEKGRARHGTAAAEIEALAAHGDVPTEEALTEARARRDELLRAFDGSPLLRVGLLDAVARTDAMADAMRREAKLVEHRALKARELRDASEAVTKLEADVASVASRTATLEGVWRDAWAPSALVPLAPSAMLAWCTDREQLLVALEAQRAAADDLRALEASLEAYLVTLARAVALAPGEDAAARDARSLDAGALRARAQALVAAADAHAAAMRDLAAARHHRDDAARKIKVIDDAEAHVRARWIASLAALGLEPDLTIAAARAVVKGLAELRAELALEPASIDRIEKIKADIAAFESDVDALLRDLGGAPLEGRHDDTIDALHAKVARARTTLATREAAERAVERSVVARREREAELAASVAALHALRARAGAGDDVDVDGPALDALAAAASRRDALRAIVDQKEQALRHTQGPFDGLEAYFDALASADEEALRVDALRSEDVVDALATKARELDTQRGADDAQLARIAGGSEAADVAGALEAEVATFAETARTYAVHTLANAILADAIARFERDHQPALLSHASTIFAAMTGGRYARVFRRLADGALQVERDGGRLLEPEELSTGTREQLYLALRLAYVEDYAARVEPLPVILDDVLVNFDEARARATLRALGGLGASSRQAGEATETSDTREPRALQVVLFTCHASMVALAREAVPHAAHVVVPAVGPSSMRA